MFQVCPFVMSKRAHKINMRKVVMIVIITDHIPTQWCIVEGNAEERRSPTYYQDMGERWYSSVPQI